MVSRLHYQILFFFKFVQSKISFSFTNNSLFHQGIWIPHGENVKIPVAIKVLQEGTSPSQSTELLEEARVMCSVEHMCCVRILAVCMKSQMMLVTQLMPHGSLLHYVRSNTQYIGSKALLNWCTQIARVR